MDKYPEELIAQATAGGAVNWVSTLVQVPLLNLPEKAGKARVLEFIKIQTNDAVQAGSNSAIVWTIGSVNYGNGQTVTTVPVNQAMTDRRNFISGRAAIGIDEYAELTDQAGNGMLYPAQSVYINVVGASGTGAVTFRLFYRIKYVALAEYIGIMNQYLVTIV
jgi:hypothetical protein